MNSPKTTKKLPKAMALLFGLALTAAACGADDVSDDAAAVAAAQTDESAAAAESEDAMEEDAMEDDAMEDGDAMEEDAMEEDAMEEDAMEDGDAMSEGRPIIELSFEGVEPLGDDFEYELWTIVDGAPVSGGIFDVDADGEIVISSDQDYLYGHDGATDVVISIEPAVDPDPAPAAPKPLGGVIADDGSFALDTTHPATFGTDFSEASGQYILGTPSDGPDTNELSGLWFLQVTDDGPAASLDLPELPEGWVYEGWAVIDGVPVSTGTFTDGAAADNFDGFTGEGNVPAYPGEDFLVNAPEGLEFPTDLSGGLAVISVEPADDNSPAPFALKPLVGEIPADAEPFTNYELGSGPAPFSATGQQNG